VKFLIDMNLSPRWAGYLTDAGFEAVHWSSLGPRDSSDIAFMAHARTQDYVVLTHDLDFSAILAATHGDKPSVAQLRADNVSPEAIGAQVAAALGAMGEELAAGALIAVDPGRTRMTVLPLRVRT
jgi:predicted nuclease of predicted toxin-antitoxin system